MTFGDLHRLKAFGVNRHPLPARPAGKDINDSLRDVEGQQIAQSPRNFLYCLSFARTLVFFFFFFFGVDCFVPDGWFATCFCRLRFCFGLCTLTIGGFPDFAFAFAFALRYCLSVLLRFIDCCSVLSGLLCTGGVVSLLLVLLWPLYRSVVFVFLFLRWDTVLSFRSASFQLIRSCCRFIK
jgi:hypothetical protein